MRGHKEEPAVSSQTIGASGGVQPLALAALMTIMVKNHRS